MEDRIVLSFFIYSFLGYICEVIYCSVPQRRFVNRGFLYGPYLPIYGFGAMIVTVLLDPLHQWPLLVFLLSFLLTSVLEYFTSWLLEKLFSVKLWDYSKHKVNINGRVCLLNSTLFGIMGIVVEYLAKPVVDDLISLIPPRAVHLIAMALFALLVSDTVLSTAKMKAFRDALQRIRTLRAEAEERIAYLQGQGKAELAQELRLRIEATLEKYREGVRSSARHIIASNPTLSSRNEALQAQLDILHRWVRERRDLRRKYASDRDEIDRKSMDELRKAGR